MAGQGRSRRQELLVGGLLLAVFNLTPSSDAFVLPLPRRVVAPSPLRSAAATPRPLHSRSSWRRPQQHGRRPLPPLRGHVSEEGDLIRAPEQMYESAVELGTEKAESPVLRTFVLAIQAGLQVGIGAAMAVATLAGLPGLTASNPAAAKLLYGVVGLPCGLLMTAATGTMLFTGNTCLAGVAFMERKISAKQLLSNWAVSFVGNLVGAVGLAALCTYAGVFSDAVPGIVKVSARKGALPFGVAFARGVLCNWLVTTAVWIAQGCRELVSKGFIVFAVITIFAALGFEHSVANMWLGPFAAMNGGQPVGEFFLRNLLPVTCGNIVAGFFIVAGTYYTSYGSFAKKRQKKSGPPPPSA